MKRLIVLRHGKAERPEFATTDFDRKLASRGKRDAVRAGEVLAEHSIIPELIVTSTARRARSTAKRAAEVFVPSAQLVESDDLYLVSVRGILEIVRTISETVSTAMLVGHNPGFGDLVDRLGGPIDAFPTAAFGVLNLNVDFWGEVDLNSPSEAGLFWYPKSELEA